MDDAREVYQRLLIRSRVGGGEMRVKKVRFDRLWVFNSQSKVANRHKEGENRLRGSYRLTRYKTISLNLRKSGSTFLH